MLQGIIVCCHFSLLSQAIVAGPDVDSQRNAAGSWINQGSPIIVCG